jgi:hypothetical protein
VTKVRATSYSRWAGGGRWVGGAAHSVFCAVVLCPRDAPASVASGPHTHSMLLYRVNRKKKHSKKGSQRRARKKGSGGSSTVHAQIHFVISVGTSLVYEKFHSQPQQAADRNYRGSHPSFLDVFMDFNVWPVDALVRSWSPCATGRAHRGSTQGESVDDLMSLELDVRETQIILIAAGKLRVRPMTRYTRLTGETHICICM